MARPGPRHKSDESSTHLTQAEEQYQRLLELSPAPIMIQSKKNELLYTNPAGAALLGAETPDDLTGKSLLDLVHPDSQETFRKCISQAKEGGKTTHPFSQKLTRLDGQIIQVEITCLPVTHNGKPAIQLLILDVPERILVELALQESEERYRQLFDGITDVCFVIDHDWRYTHVNQAASRATRRNESELIGQRITDILPDIKDTIQYQTYRQVMETRQPHRFTTDSLLPNGPQGTYEVSVYPVSGGILCIAHDITERVQVEEALRGSEERYRQMFEKNRAIKLIVDPDTGAIIDANPAACQFYGYNRADLRSMHIMDIDVRPENQVLSDIRHARSGVRTYFSFQHKLAGGGTRDVEVHASPIEVQGEAFIYVIVHDITSRTMVEQAAREQRALAEALRDTAAALSSTLDVDEVLERILTNVGRVVPHDAATIMLVDGDSAHVVRYRGYAKRMADEVILTSRYSVVDTPSLRIMAENGEPLAIPDAQSQPGWVVPSWTRSYAGAPICLEDEVIGFLNLDNSTPGFYNMTHARRLRAFADQAAIAIRNARLYESIHHHATELEARNVELDAFTYTVAHDLKAPLHIILGFANLLTTDYADEVSDEAHDHLCLIEGYAHRMNKMIENLLTLAHLREAEEAVEEVAIAPVVQAALERLKGRVDDRAVTIEVADNLPPALGYGPWLEEVFANLIDNAIKYIGKDNPEPRIAIQGIFQEDNHTVRYEVEDNGTGIQPDNIERLFEMFTRFHTGEIGGSGLGLSIVRRIITKLNGEVGVESVPGEGSTFWFTLPAP